MSIKLNTRSVVTVTSAGTRVQVSSTDLYAYDVIFQAPTANAANIFIGDSTVSSSNGLILTPGDSMSLSGTVFKTHTDQFNLKDIYVDSTSNNQTCRVAYINNKPAG